jgi:hypothetical protein
MSTPVRGRWVKASKRAEMWISRMESQERIDVSRRPSSCQWLLRWTVFRVRDAGPACESLSASTVTYDDPGGSRPVGPRLP